MKYRRLGRTGLRVSEIGLGTMTFGSMADEATSIEIMDRAAEAGVTRAMLQHLCHTDVEMVELIGTELVPAVAAA